MEDSIFSKWSWLNWMTACKKMKRDPYLSSFTKLNSKQMKDPQHKAGHTKYRRESGEIPGINWCRRQFPEENTNGLGSNIKN